jgi:hypothetical protein
MAQLSVVGRGAEVAIVDDAGVEEGIDLPKGVKVYLARVLLSAGAGVDGDIGQRVVVEDRN